jgi:GNAT superfamily N-acetyltransferase
MVVVRAATMEEWQVLRDIRLAALRDAPNVFGSTYAEQAASVEADWRRRISRGGTFFAYVPEVDGNEPSGLVGGFQEKPATVELVSLWVRPRVRGLGVGDALVAAVIDWARARNATSVHLWLTETNQHARMLYERCGFSPTDERQPLPSKSDLTEVGMICPL